MGERCFVATVSLLERWFAQSRYFFLRLAWSIGSHISVASYTMYWTTVLVWTVFLIGAVTGGGRLVLGCLLCLLITAFMLGMQLFKNKS